MIQLCLPIPTLSFSYTMNGVALDKPSAASGPLLQGGNALAGTTFALLFQSPSTATQNALASGVSGTMIFAAVDGSSLSGMVKITSFSSGSLFVATCTLLALLSINRNVISTQFY